ncbi:hypothetical protein NEMIN01_2393 [Nematocida minor]|uniref:uncharacterized protein n=1 Tax=Nematocida minor TaxID=1912983 RepID=UPI00221EAAA2|nr:uncharacterized protein NEMIN01_2393 [Nematocida minor]KAI5193064.1 hypothetical protein NEMIN01_2393 [Nematocida minor]
MEKIVPAMKRKITSEEVNKNSLFGVMSPGKISAACLDEGIFPDEILERIEKRREQLLGKIEEFVKKSQTKSLEDHEKTNGIEEIKTTIRIILLEIEKLQAQTGSNCVKECDRMINELENIHIKVKAEKRWHKLLYRCTGVFALFVLWAICKDMLRGNISACY